LLLPPEPQKRSASILTLSLLPHESLGALPHLLGRHILNVHGDPPSGVAAPSLRIALTGVQFRDTHAGQGSNIGFNY
jgi:hypothetical protein